LEGRGGAGWRCGPASGEITKGREARAPACRQREETMFHFDWKKGAVAGAALLASTGFMAFGASAETVLRMNNWLPPQHSQLVGTMKPWAEKVAEASKGNIRIELTDASLGAPPRQYDLAVDGIVDVTFGVTGYTPGRFKLPGVAELPFVAQSAE